MKTKKTWAEKLDAGKPYEVKPAPITIAGMQAGTMMLVPTARIVDTFIRSIPEGVSIHVKSLRRALADLYGAEVTCPITTGFHLKTVAEAAFEAFQQGAPLSEITPIWRVLDAQTPTTKRLSYDPAFIINQRAREGL